MQQGPFHCLFCTATKPTCPGTLNTKKGKLPGFSPLNWMNSGVDTIGLIKHKSESWWDSPSFAPCKGTIGDCTELQAPRVTSYLAIPYMAPPGVEHYGDPAGLTRNPVFIIIANHIPLGFIRHLHK